MPRIGLVTVLYNSASVLEGFVRSLARQDAREFVLWAVDNASTDGSGEECRRRCAEHDVELRLIANGVNWGVARANNQGIEAALEDGCEYVVLANNDIEFGPATLSQLLDKAKESAADILAPLVLQHETGRVWFAGGTFSRLKGTNVHWHFDKPVAALGLRDRYIAYAPTCFIACHRSVFRRAGMMDERYFVYFDDTDFMWRARTAGLRILFVHDVIINHKASASTGGELSDFAIRHLARNRVFFLLKNLGRVRSLFCLGVFLASRIPFLAARSPRQRRLFLSAVWEGIAMSRKSAAAGDAA